MSELQLLERVREQVADRDPIDWTSIEAMAASQALAPEARAELAMLKLLDEIAAAHTTTPLEESDGSDAPADADTGDDTLTSWGRYRLDEKVGRGGFGSVYRAWDPELEMAVAIKILHRRFGDESLQERLLHEGRALAQVRHPNVVRVLNVERNDARLGLVMEFLRGETLHSIVESQGPLNEREAAVIGEDVSRALAAVHGLKLIHRDVKARNVIRERAGRCVLMDFGAGLQEGQRGSAVGTPLYMAPELLNGDTPTVASDIYGVGVLLFFLVTGRYPYEGSSVAEIRAAHAGRQRQSLLALRPELPLWFVDVVDRALAAAPETRFASAGALAQALASARHGGTSWAKRVAFAAAAVAGLAALATIGGMLSSAAFNAMLGRTAYADESAGGWLRLGFRSMLLPLLLSLLSAGAVAFLLALRRVLVGASPGLARLDRSVAGGCRRWAGRLSLTEPTVCASWLLLASAVAIVAIWSYWSPLFVAVTSDISTAPADVFAVLSGSSTEYRTHYRMALSVLAAFNVAGWMLIVRASRLRALPAWMTGAEIVLLVLLFLSMQIPYRIFHDNDEFPLVTWRETQCHMLGARDEEALLFCPPHVPRRELVDRREVQFVSTAAHVGLFETFASAR